MDGLEEDAAFVGDRHLLLCPFLRVLCAQRVDGERRKLLARVAVGSHRGRVGLQDAPVLAAHEENDVTAVGRDELVPMQGLFLALAIALLVFAESQIPLQGCRSLPRTSVEPGHRAREDADAREDDERHDVGGPLDVPHAPRGEHEVGAEERRKGGRRNARKKAAEDRGEHHRRVEGDERGEDPEARGECLPREERGHDQNRAHGVASEGSLQ